MNTIALPLLLFVASADEPPKPKLPVGKDTTYATGPLDKQGYIDYEAVLNERLGKGITPEKNANVLLWKAFGPTPDGPERTPADYFKLLGIPEPPKEGNYFTPLYRYGKERLKLDSDERSVLYGEQSATTQRPWTEKDYPRIAAWLKLNEKPLALIVEATKRPEYFNPLVSRRKDGERDFLIGLLLPSVYCCRDAADALTARATLRLSEGKFDAAWEDLMACHRLGRLVGRGGTLLEAVVSFAIGRVAADATLAYLERANLTAEKVLARLKELCDLPPAAQPADKLELADRLIALDVIQFAHRNGFEALAKEECAPADQLDWEALLRTVNKWYDRMVAAMRMKDRAAREKEFDKIEKELKDRASAAGNLDDLRKKLEDGGDAGKEISTRIGDLLANLLRPGVRGVQQKFECAQQAERNLHVAFALAAYRKDKGRSPAKLTDLAPKYMKDVPEDLFASKPLIYKPAEKGYLFYSVGPNGKDDAGRGPEDEPPGDDIGVKMPLPELKK